MTFNRLGFSHVYTCKLSSYKKKRLLEQFVTGRSARTAADLIGIHRNSAICGKVEVDEGYFGGVRKEKRGRGAAKKTIVCGILKRGGSLYAIPVADVTQDTLLPVIREKIKNPPPEGMVLCLPQQG
ncbi:MAG: hypothetical protein CSA20_02960 [Deltaproteobacteria bacterium]|nr:MAG: hypothetical protein CSA20_02960 [Deltaproteobacteria bacterium]